MLRPAGYGLSNGDLLTKEDVFGNDGADKGAKQAVEEHRVPAAEVNTWKRLEDDAMARAKRTGKVTSLACNHPEFTLKDNEASRWKVDAGKKTKEAKKAAKDRQVPAVVAP